MYYQSMASWLLVVPFQACSLRLLGWGPLPDSAVFGVRGILCYLYAGIRVASLALIGCCLGLVGLLDSLTGLITASSGFPRTVSWQQLNWANA